MRFSVFLTSLSVVFSGAAGQAQREAAFQAASIHVHAPDTHGILGFYSTGGGRVQLGMCTLPMLVSYALDIDTTLVAGTPSWADKVHYDIKAVPPDDSPSRKNNLDGYTASPNAEQRAMLLSLLKERFGLRYRIVEKTMPVYVLMRGKGPLKLEKPQYPERAADPRGALVMRGDLVTGEGFGQSLTMAYLARQLMWPLDRPVIDRTGIEGVYDFHVDPIEPENRDRVHGALLMTEALGLKLTSGRAPVRTVQIDAATPPTEN